MNVTVFGGSQMKAGDQAYQESYVLGRLLAQGGHTLLTGGYIGSMEAVSRGANEAGGHVIGVTCEEIEQWRNVKANPWVKEERRFQTLEQRLSELVHACDTAIALPGGPGTLTEISLTWNLMIVGSIPKKPLILLGTAWRNVFDSFIREQGNYIPSIQRSLLRFALTNDEAMKLLQAIE